jgi:NADPH:quinone reductase-like Zn-dependent oxidoreductase
MGRDLSGVVEAVGPGVMTLVTGSEVYAMLDYGCDRAEGHTRGKIVLPVVDE